MKMESVLKSLYQSLAEFDAKYKDERLENSFMLGSPLSVALLTLLYWVFVMIVGPALMKNRRPFRLTRVLLVYNLLQVLANFYMFSEVTRHISNRAFYPDFGCMLSDRSYSPKGLAQLYNAKMYFWLKVSDFADTIFFVLRKSNKQITFLHVYHHMIMVFATFLTLRYVVSGHVIVVGYINFVVHMVMYSYYLVSALRPGLKDSLWWKRHVTQIQIIQFIILTIHFARPILRDDCPNSKAVMFLYLAQSAMMLFMFADFYVKAYIWKPKKVKKST